MKTIRRVFRVPIVNLPRVRRIAARINALFIDRELVLRSGGALRFVRVSRRAQLRAAAGAGAALMALGTGTGLLAWHVASLDAAHDQIALERQQISGKAATVSAYSRSVDGLARDLEQRQQAIEALARDHFGAPVGEQGAPAPSKPGKIGAVLPAVGRLMALDARQRDFARRLAALAEQRVTRAEAAIRGLGLNPATITAGAPRGQGGPFIPAALPADLQPLALTLSRLDALETGLAAMPTGRPTDAPMETSSFGYRRDPFNGATAFHAGIDFPGRYGQPIVAAANGRVSYVGPRPGYGKVVEIDHGHAIMTRYAHLSGYGARVGQRVARGEPIGRMGSTGRSTGTHLHFEVRLNGAAINPRRFLEARSDVLETQQIAGSRINAVRERG
jgi:murein DD-endopeptidase MepM/ murein hydrolase activator NlpD